MPAIAGATTDRHLNKHAYALQNKAAALTSIAGADRIAVSDDSADGEVKYVTVADMQGGPGMVETLITTKAVSATESGKTFFLDLAAGFTTTLPAPAIGLRYKFIVKTAPTTAYIINTPTANIMVVSVNELETDTTEDGPSDDDADTFNFVANVALPGDFVDVYCDGTKWYLLGQSRADGAVTTSTT